MCMITLCVCGGGGCGEGMGGGVVRQPSPVICIKRAMSCSKARSPHITPIIRL